MDDYITKPIIMPVLSEKLATHCKQWPLQPEPKPEPKPEPEP